MNNCVEISSGADASQQESSEWNTVVFDLRRSVSNLVLYVLESMPLPWVFPPIASAQSFQQFQSDANVSGAGMTATAATTHYGNDDVNRLPDDWFIPPLPPIDDGSLLLPSTMGQQPPHVDQDSKPPKRASKKKTPSGSAKSSV
jgi:hypothetical protein